MQSIKSFSIEHLLSIVPPKNEDVNTTVNAKILKGSRTSGVELTSKSSKRTDEFGFVHQFDLSESGSSSSHADGDSPFFSDIFVPSSILGSLPGIEKHGGFGWRDTDLGAAVASRKDQLTGTSGYEKATMDCDTEQGFRAISDVISDDMESRFPGQCGVHHRQYLPWHSGEQLSKPGHAISLNPPRKHNFISLGSSRICNAPTGVTSSVDYGDALRTVRASSQTPSSAAVVPSIQTMHLEWMTQNGNYATHADSNGIPSNPQVFSHYLLY